MEKYKKDLKFVKSYGYNKTVIRVYNDTMRKHFHFPNT